MEIWSRHNALAFHCVYRVYNGNDSDRIRDKRKPNQIICRNDFVQRNHGTRTSCSIVRFVIFVDFLVYFFLFGFPGYFLSTWMLGQSKYLRRQQWICFEWFRNRSHGVRCAPGHREMCIRNRKPSNIPGSRQGKLANSLRLVFTDWLPGQ